MLPGAALCHQLFIMKSAPAQEHGRGIPVVREGAS
jgi:hypothetical protein